MDKRINITDLSAHFTQTVESTYLVRTIEESTSESNKKFYTLQLMDATGSIWGRIWEENMKEAHLSMTGEVVTVRGIVIQSQNQTYQLVIRSMDRAQEYDMSDFVKGLTPEEAAKYLGYLRKYIKSIRHEGLKKLAEEVYNGIPDLSELPATLTGHHNFNGGYLVYTVSITCLVNHMLKSLSSYDRHDGHPMDYRPDILTCAALLHAVGTADMLTPYPDSRRIPSSIPLSIYDLTLKKVTETAARHPEIPLEEQDFNLLLHAICCVYAQEERKPMLREALILKSAVELQKKISLFDHFLSVNADKEGMVYDNVLGNYLYIEQKQKEERHE